MAYETHGFIVITAKRVPSNLRSKFPNTARVPDLARNVQCNNSPRHLRVFLADRRASFLADCARHPGSFHEMDRRLISGAVQTAILRQKFYTLWCKTLASKHHIHSRSTGKPQFSEVAERRPAGLLATCPKIFTGLGVCTAINDFVNSSYRSAGA